MATRVPAATALAGAAIVAAGAAAYANSFGVPFVFDDGPAIVENPTLRHGWALWRALDTRGTDSSASGRPLANVSFAFNRALGGDAVWSYHAANLAIHLLAALTLFGLVRRTLDRTSPGATVTAFAAALLWAVHPLQTEAVTYIVQRTESLMGLFYLLTVYCFVRAAPPTPPTAGNGRARERAGAAAPWLTLSILACALGMATKEVMATAPVIVLLYDRTFVAGSLGAALRRRGWYYGGLAATWLVLAALLAGEGWNRGGTAGFYRGAAPWDYLLTQPGAVLRYLELTFWPRGQAFDYGAALATSLRAAALPGICVAALALATLAGLARKSRIAFLGAWFFLTLAPSSSVMPIMTQTVAEHRMYLPLAAVAVLAALALRTLPRTEMLIATAAVAAALGAATHARNAVYRSGETLWADTVRSCPDNGRARLNLGEALLESGRPADAAEEFRAAIRLDPRSADAHDNLGVALSRVGRPADAVNEIEAAVRLQPDAATFRNNLGNALLRSGRTAEAIGQYRWALRIDPGFAHARVDLCNALLTAGRVDEAIDEGTAALRADPASADAHFNLGNALLRSGRAPDAIAQYRAVLRLQPDAADARQALAQAEAMLQAQNSASSPLPP